MSLSYYFTFNARPEIKAEELMAFLKGVEIEAKRLGFSPTLVLNASFDTVERRQFARRLTMGLRIADERLAGAEFLGNAAIWRRNPQDGSCRLLPTNGVVLAVSRCQGSCNCPLARPHIQPRLPACSSVPISRPPCSQGRSCQC